jgi:DNA polymerase-3 subunit alpha
VLLARTTRGGRTCWYLCSEAYLTGFYYKPRIDRELLEKHSAGLIAINGHLGSEIGDHLLDYERTRDRKHWEAARWRARQWHKRVFARREGSGGGARGRSPRFYVELQHHMPEQNSINPHLVIAGTRADLPLVCDNDSHFLKAEDHDAHDTLICISTGKLKSEPNRMHYPPELYVKSPEQMREMFEGEYHDIGREALRQHGAIAERCNVELPLGEEQRARGAGAGAAPEGPAAPRRCGVRGRPDGVVQGLLREFELEPFDRAPTADELAEAKKNCDRRCGCSPRRDSCGDTGRKARKRLARGTGNDGPEQWARLERELKILADKNISAYFLIVWDFVNWGRQRGIPANARGSGVGTMVGYVLGLSNACPVRYGLLFERFTDPDRSEYPDIDIDLCQDGRGEVINYVRRSTGTSRRSSRSGR